jgi:hypothetical protein
MHGRHGAGTGSSAERLVAFAIYSSFVLILSCDSIRPTSARIQRRSIPFHLQNSNMKKTTQQICLRWYGTLPLGRRLDSRRFVLFFVIGVSPPALFFDFLIYDTVLLVFAFNPFKLGPNNHDGQERNAHFSADVYMLLQ